MSSDEGRPTRTGARLGAVFVVGEFRSMWAAEVLSVFGDQLARVALAVIVFDRSHSAALTGLTYALTFVPSFLGGAALGGLADRWPRRTVMVATDVVRAVLIGAAAIPRVPLWVLLVLIAAATLFNGPFKAAQQALLPAVLPDELYTPAMAVRSVSSQSAQLLGFAGGGVIVATCGGSLSMGLDAATFAISAVLLVAGVRARPAARTDGVGMVAAVRAGTVLVWRDPVLRPLVGLCWLAGFYVVPEALAAPYASALGGGAITVGAVMAADPIGSVVGGLAWGTWVPEATQRRVMAVLGIAAGLPLLVCALQPPLAVSMLLFALSGAAATGYTIQATVSFVRRLPDERRAHGSGVLSSGLITVQGIGALVFGALADAIGAGDAIAVAGGLGAAVAIPIALSWARALRLPPRAHAGDDSGVAVGHDDLRSDAGGG